MLVLLHEAPTSTLRGILREFGDTRAHTLPRRGCIQVLERVHSVFVVSEDGTEYGIGDVQHSDDFIQTTTKNTLPEEPNSITRQIVPQQLTVVPELPNNCRVVKKTLQTDAKYDVVVAEIIKVHNNVHFAPETLLTDMHNELFVSRNLLSDMQQETSALLANVDTFDLQLTKPIDIATTNQLGTVYELRMHVDNGTIEYDNAAFRCQRSDQFVFVNIRFRVTKCVNVAMLTIDLPYSIIRAEHVVPFQATLKETNSTDFSVMARAYGTGNKVFVESHVFQELPAEINIQGQYLTSFNEPFLDKSFNNPRAFTWITPMRYDTNHGVHLNGDMVHMRDDVPTGSTTDLGFSDGHLSWTRVQDRVDITGYVRFRQERQNHVDVVRCDVDIPFTLETLLPHARSHGYGATYATEHNRFLSDRPIITVRPDLPEFQMAIDARTRRVPFYELVVQFQVSLFVVSPRRRIHHLEKPIVQSNLEVVNNAIHVSGVRLFDTWNPSTLFHTYNMNLRSVNNKEYQEYRFTPLALDLKHALSFQTLTIFDIRLYNQLDDQNVQYLYPRRKEYHMRIHATNYKDDYEVYNLTPDFSQYLNI